MYLGWKHWIAALGLALSIHLSLFASLRPPQRQAGAVSAGFEGVEIALAAGGPLAASGPSETEAVEAVQPPMAPPPPPPEPQVVEPVIPVAPPPVAKKPDIAPPKPRKVVARPPKPKEPPPPEKVEETVESPPAVPETHEKVAVASATAESHGSSGGSNTQQGTGHGNRSAGGGVPGAKADYFSHLKAWLERHRRYPRRAQMRRQEGTALLYFVIDPQGNVLDYRIERSSGYKLLDREVEDMLERAKPLPPIPKPLRQAKLELLLPISFELH